MTTHTMAAHGCIGDIHFLEFQSFKRDVRLTSMVSAALPIPSCNKDQPISRLSSSLFLFLSIHFVDEDQNAAALISPLQETTTTTFIHPPVQHSVHPLQRPKLEDCQCSDLQLTMTHSNLHLRLSNTPSISFSLFFLDFSGTGIGYKLLKPFRDLALSAMESSKQESNLAHIMDSNRGLRRHR
uniref:Uncharacterized protein n=1 Tax=Nelumbo nucifera TaxID=4432 RepID=A0A822XV15_NELNU|nr:TPA_asm: hypothetical protein HUJ06_024392 [Nelumbo nucifera]